MPLYYPTRRRIILSIAFGIFLHSILAERKDIRSLIENPSLLDKEQQNDNAATEYNPPDEVKKPVMHTFFEPVDNKYGCCGMSHKGHNTLLSAWKQAWEDRGWEVKVLTKENSMDHPDFDMLTDKLQDLHVGDYDTKCFWRWLAMASREDDNGEGLWMSDYDVFPLQLDAEEGRKIANDGTFKSFSRHVPCLIHASRNEWDRVIHLMIDQLDNRRGKISDMFMLKQVEQSLGMSGMIWSAEVADTFIYSKNMTGGLFINCEHFSWMRAVHLSHAGVQNAWKMGIHPHLDKVRGPGTAIQWRGESSIQVSFFHLHT